MDKVATVRNAASGGRIVRAAQYLRMSKEHQTYSIDNQKDAIRNYADIMGYDIVATYEDAGRSGLNLGGRPGLQQMLADVESGRAEFETVVVYDVSRWGRFQNIDESAAYEYRCQMAGVRIEYCAEQFANDGSVGSDVLKAIKRSMAAEHSRMLSQKTFIGQARLIRLGFRQGGEPGLGLRRQLIDHSGRPKLVLSEREQKSVHTDRMILVPGPPEEIATVRWIFRHFVKTHKTETEMAKLLNKRGVMTDLGRPWKRETVRGVLTNEKYIGNNVWNRRSRKLKAKAADNPPEQWVRAEGAFEPIVDRKLFERAQRIHKTLYSRMSMSNGEMLAALKKVLARQGVLSTSIIDAAPDCPAASLYYQRFGGILKAYELIGYQPARNWQFIASKEPLAMMRIQAIENLAATIGRAGGKVIYDRENDLLRINDEFTVAIEIARCSTSDYGYPFWSLNTQRQSLADIFTLIRMRPGDLVIRDYLIAPMSKIVGKSELRANNGAQLDTYLFPTLTPLTRLADRASAENILWA
ncbi:recombinase family protein [Mesorhizobium sp. M1C.F.Ca.ET.193.01.1.1]|uniref:recombinase family protein n=2 Tax=Mesorhizobium TaxID=68287 RepID=UPI000FD5578D|nr:MULTISPECIES: recombinase family protein [unclassified Mesorhizobium]TGS97159.1 recombinase family protein [bacterium M00.F.Ca.ET.177.01.1.1]TGQ52320.1 recombinase family protein [Mesorhizobium sp. M1C.F.Ca.ET.210.01.1.1]TGQ68950.1 recombinase family protein [Mesorhizobium sp. M1C.F.Ca.ET.212.01.1.1]TGR04503.1 recombinase family protein [Mesorhizobium sp. M1C.F.Ca.ET.204.01.1.1]TGR25270.1 recombinase family protein [Mesorhizobium sp. M1C.F.Ca.ET.196.01.1.1]